MAQFLSDRVTLFEIRVAVVQVFSPKHNWILNSHITALESLLVGENVIRFSG